MSSDNRVFEIYLRLQDGEELTVAQLQQEYGKSRRTVYQDLQEIRETLAEVTHSGQELIETPDGKRKLSKSNTLDERHIYALSKILLESRAFNKAETCKILNDLFSVESHQTGKWLHHSILNEMENYQSITNQNNRLNLLYQLETAIQENKEIQFNYHAVDELGYLGPDKLDKTVKLNPLGVFFDNFYFYLAGIINDKDFQTFHVKDISQLKTFPVERDKQAKALWDIKKTRYHTQFAYSYGEEIQVKFEYYGYIGYVLDRFPEARYKKLDKTNPNANSPWNQHFLVYEVTLSLNRNRGTIMWSLSQIPWLKVLSPQVLIDEISGYAQLGINRHPLSENAEQAQGHDLSALLDKYED